MSEMHWAARYIGLPWTPGHSDCWSFARRVWAERFGWDVPPLIIDPQNPRAVRQALAENPVDQGWTAIPDPVEGSAVLMGQGLRPCHVGIWITPEAGAGILHSIEVAGVIFSSSGRLAGLGYRIHGFWHRGG